MESHQRVITLLILVPFVEQLRVWCYTPLFSTSDLFKTHPVLRQATGGIVHMIQADLMTLTNYDVMTNMQGCYTWLRLGQVQIIQK